MKRHCSSHWEIRKATISANYNMKAFVSISTIFSFNSITKTQSLKPAFFQTIQLISNYTHCFHSWNEKLSRHNCWKRTKDCFQQHEYSGVLLKWEFFIKMRAALLPRSFKKEEYWSEDGCKLEALILMKKYYFKRTLQYIWGTSARRSVWPI